LIATYFGVEQQSLMVSGVTDWGRRANRHPWQDKST